MSNINSNLVYLYLRHECKMLFNNLINLLVHFSMAVEILCSYYEYFFHSKNKNKYNKKKLFFLHLKCAFSLFYVVCVDVKC